MACPEQHPSESRRRRRGRFRADPVGRRATRTAEPCATRTAEPCATRTAEPCAAAAAAPRASSENAQNHHRQEARRRRCRSAGLSYIDTAVMRLAESSLTARSSLIQGPNRRGPLYKVRTGAVPYTRSEPARCDRDNVSSGRNVTFGAMSVEHRSTARTSAPDIALFRKDSGDVTGRADEQIGTAAGDVAVPARVRK